MRFFRWRVWRAIPALDGLTPERAKAFVKRTKNLRQWRAARWWFTAFAFFPAMWLTIGGVYLAGELAGRKGDDLLDGRGMSATIFVLMSVWFVAAPIVVCLCIHRWFVLQAVRSALTRRGRCEGCGYTLTGLPLRDGDVVKCSECGRETVAERGLGEVREEAGRAVYDPPERSFKWQFSRKSVWKWGKRAAVAAAVTAVALGAWWGWAEWTLRRDAGLAAADRTGLAPLRQMWLDLQPAGSSPSDANAWKEFQRSLTLVTKANQSVWDKPSADPSAPVRVPDYSAVGYVVPGDAADVAAARALAEQMLPVLREAGVFDAWRAMRAAPRREGEIAVPVGAPANNLTCPELGQLREVARMNRARMVVAARSGELEEFCDALANVTAMAGMSAEHPTYFGGRVACVLDSMGLSQVRQVLYSHPSKAWLDGMEAGMTPDRPRPARSYMFKADREMMLDTMAAVFTDRKGVKRKRWEAWFGDKNGVRRPVGDYETNKREMDAYLTGMVVAAEADPFNRGPLPTQNSPHVLVQLLFAPTVGGLLSLDQTELDRRGTRVMVAIERYRLEHGSSPDELQQLVPAFLPSLPLDPWSGKPLCYRKLTPEQSQADRVHREYFLWSVGRDGVDNGGVMRGIGGERYEALTSSAASGVDFVINDPDL